MITLNEALHLHKLFIEIWGGNDDIRDHGPVESAVNRPHCYFWKRRPEDIALFIELQSALI